MLETVVKPSAVNFARNTGVHPLTLIDIEGIPHVFTPGLSICRVMDAVTLETFSGLAEEVDILSASSLKALSIASFKKLVTGQITIEALKLLMTSDLKAGQLTAAREVAFSEGIAA